MRELGEGSKMLEDQLRLMDEKYLELRGKLELAQERFHSKIKRISAECNGLRVRYAKTHHGALLDAVKEEMNEMSQSRPIRSGCSNHHHYDHHNNSTGLMVDFDNGRLSPTLPKVNVNPLQMKSFDNNPQTNDSGKRPPSPLLRSGTRTQFVTAESATHLQQYDNNGVTMKPFNHSSYGMMRQLSEGTIKTADHIFQQQQRPFSASSSHAYSGQQQQSQRQRPKLASGTAKRLQSRQGGSGKKTEEERALQSALKKIQKRSGSRVQEKWNAERLSDLLAMCD